MYASWSEMDVSGRQRWAPLVSSTPSTTTFSTISSTPPFLVFVPLPFTTSTTTPFSSTLASTTTTTTTTTTTSTTTTTTISSTPQTISFRSSMSGPTPPPYLFLSLLFFACFLGLVFGIYLLIKLYFYISRKKRPLPTVSTVPQTVPACPPAPESVPLVPLPHSSTLSAAVAYTFVPSTRSLQTFATYEVKSRGSNYTFELKPSHTHDSNLTYEIV